MKFRGKGRRMWDEEEALREEETVRQLHRWSFSELENKNREFSDRI